MIKAIIFDLGGVVFTNGTKLLAKYIAEKYYKDFQEIYTFLKYSHISDSFRRGEVTENEFWQAFKNKFKIEDIANLKQKWLDVFEVIGETKHIILDLKVKYKVYFLSDNIKTRIDTAEKKYGFKKWFNGGIVSYEVGLKKPDIEIHQQILRKTRVKPEEVIFIDDIETNLVPARNMGMHTVIFKNPEKLREELNIIL